jgi:hypothetical protein
MSKSIFRKITISAAAMLLFGCSASYVTLPPEFDVQPVEEQNGYFTEDESLECSNTYIEFVQQEGDLFLFYVEVKNNSEDTLVVYPEEIYLEVVEGIENSNDHYHNRYFALNPANEVEQINKQLKEENNRHEGATVVNVASGVFRTIVDLVSDSEYKEEAVATDVFSTGMNQVGEEVYHSNAEKDLEGIKDFWLNDMLNESLINPGETVSGLVYLPYSLNARMFKVVVPVCGYPDTYTFRQFRKN